MARSDDEIDDEVMHHESWMPLDSSVAGDVTCDTQQATASFFDRDP